MFPRWNGLGESSLKALPTSQVILQPFRCFTYVTVHSPNLLSLLLRHSPNFSSLHLRHNSFSNPFVALPSSQLILQPFCCFTYVTVHCPTLLSLLLRHSSTFSSLHLCRNSFSNTFVPLPMSQLILQPFHCFTWHSSFSNLIRHFTYVTAHFPTLLSLCSFSKLSVISPTSQFILQPFFCFSYVTSSSLNSPGELPMLHTFNYSFVNILLNLFFTSISRPTSWSLPFQSIFQWLFWYLLAWPNHLILLPYMEGSVHN